VQDNRKLNRHSSCGWSESDGGRFKVSRHETYLQRRTLKPSFDLHPC
jgi:hypothetical protein